MTALVAPFIAPVFPFANLAVALEKLRRDLPMIACGLIVLAVAVDLYIATRAPALPDMVTFAFRV
jgi:hypothetical protein